MVGRRSRWQTYVRLMVVKRRTGWGYETLGGSTRRWWARTRLARRTRDLPAGTTVELDHLRLRLAGQKPAVGDDLAGAESGSFGGYLSSAIENVGRSQWKNVGYWLGAWAPTASPVSAAAGREGSEARSRARRVRQV
jgi:hypothetical protein